MKKRAVGYCRISTLMQVYNTSLKKKKKKIRIKKKKEKETSFHSKNAHQKLKPGFCKYNYMTLNGTG